MSIQAVISIVNAMQADGVVERYAIGGAVGATFYLEPVVTLDIDIFVSFQPDPGRLLVSPSAIFEYLSAKGCPMEGEYIVVAGWPVQFLPPPSLLVEEALREAVARNVGDTAASVFTAEHLAAIALQTGRTKDKARLLDFIEASAIDLSKFQIIVRRHGLELAWERFRRQFLGDTP